MKRLVNIPKSIQSSFGSIRVHCVPQKCLCSVTIWRAVLCPPRSKGEPIPTIPVVSHMLGGN